MEIIEKIEILRNKLEVLKKSGKKIGFVPTMGALHDGHISLINCAEKQNDIIVVSIFVNPTQFNNINDLTTYPRNNDKDIEILKKTKCKFLFLPSVEEIYPDDKSKEIKYNFGYLTTVMEGKYRPSHFDGVALVVSKLFNIVKPNNAYFGQKDFQQFIVIQHLANYFLSELNINVIRCPIIREADGLAMSSRNIRLNNIQRESAVLISKTLFEAKEKFIKLSVNDLKAWINDKINQDENLVVEYIEIVTDPDLIEITDWNTKDKIVACIAVNVGDIRLIDNVYFN
ncbi:MAG: pantoate--beta-alanine ligase [Bacteroidales bacterium]|nr:pantoate--beta-alanine ligase [Bacteroidales bacterium]MBN2757905.1 pantoate--beta-alanine ligase [Bacteroidales bacterium]